MKISLYKKLFHSRKPRLGLPGFLEDPGQAGRESYAQFFHLTIIVADLVDG